MEVAFIGVGSMGGAIATRLLESRPLRVFDLNPDLATALEPKGATAFTTASDAVAGADLVLTCLPTSHQVEDALFGESGFAGALKSGALVCDMTTGDPGMTRGLAERLAAETDAKMIDAPVSGGPKGALAGTLAIMVGGPDDLVAVARPVLEQLSPNLFHTGATGTGHTMKLINNMVSAGTRAVTFEALTLAVKNGLDAETATAVLNKSGGRSFTTDFTIPNFILSGVMDQGFSLGLMHKDVSLANKMGHDTETPLLIAGMMREIYQSAINAYGADTDVSHLLTLFEQAAKVKVVED